MRVKGLSARLETTHHLESWSATITVSATAVASRAPLRRAAEEVDLRLSEDELSTPVGTRLAIYADISPRNRL